MKKFLVSALLIIFLSSCSSVSKDLKDPNLTPEEFFQKAQEGVINWNKYNAAIRYYEEFINRYPDMKGKVIEAEYEIAFIKYKQHKYDDAAERLSQLLDKYQTDEAIYYPEWPRTLSGKLLANIQAEEKKPLLKKIFHPDLGTVDQTFANEKEQEKLERQQAKREKKEAKIQARQEKQAEKEAKKAAKQKQDA
ncbi:MAG: hypothetical protein MJ215_03800 [Spirochaetia bacterium]|nr:hypothetical protein [Spirochaetia bacterium]